MTLCRAHGLTVTVYFVYNLNTEHTISPVVFFCHMKAITTTPNTLSPDETAGDRACPPPRQQTRPTVQTSSTHFGFGRPVRKNMSNTGNDGTGEGELHNPVDGQGNECRKGTRTGLGAQPTQVQGGGQTTSPTDTAMAATRIEAVIVLDINDRML